MSLSAEPKQTGVMCPPRKDCSIEGFAAPLRQLHLVPESAKSCGGSSAFDARIVRPQTGRYFRVLQANGIGVEISPEGLPRPGSASTSAGNEGERILDVVEELRTGLSSRGPSC